MPQFQEPLRGFEPAFGCFVVILQVAILCVGKALKKSQRGKGAFWVGTIVCGATVLSMLLVAFVLPSNMNSRWPKTPDGWGVMMNVWIFVFMMQVLASFVSGVTTLGALVWAIIRRMGRAGWIASVFPGSCWSIPFRRD